MVTSTIARGTVAASAALVLALSACSSSKTIGAGAGAPANTGGPSSSTASGTASALTLSNGVLVGPSGHTLYFNTVDTAASIRCTAACAAEWPPLTGAVTAGSGVKQGDLATAKRADGSAQVTYLGHPLYYFAGDSAPGDKKGNGLKDQGGEWYATTPKEAADEKPGVDAPAGSGGSGQPASSTSSGGSGYTY